MAHHTSRLVVCAQVLFVAGFGSSMVFGTFVGSLADLLGRKKLCLIYVLVYVLSCMTKHVNRYDVLMAGRILGGIATSLLFSVFEVGFEQHANNRYAIPCTATTNTHAGRSVASLESGAQDHAVCATSVLVVWPRCPAGLAGVRAQREAIQ